MSTPATLPQSADGVLKLAAQSMFDLFAQTAMGMMVVDREHRIVWISDGYKRFLPALGVAGEAEFVGKRVEEVVPNTLMAQVIETGRPILVDLLTNKAGTFLVSRLPLRDDAGVVIGAVGLVLMDHPESTMQPLMVKFSRLQRELEDAQRQLAAQRRPKYTIASFIGASPAALEVKRQARRVAGTDSTVLLLGDTGTGKELLAHAIHAASARAAAPFVTVNIAAVPETLLEAEFFGVAPGAYTGADRKGREGKFKLADHGTLFLDEIGDMPLPLQAKLLRALQEQEVEPLGSNRVERVDVRVIAATSRDLLGDGGAGPFSRGPVLPAARAADPAAAAASTGWPTWSRWPTRCSTTSRGAAAWPHKSLASDAMELLARHGWPGNIRELRNVLEQAALMTDDLVLSARHLSLQPSGAVPAATAALPAIEAASIRPLPQAIAELELRAIRDALAATGGNKLAAAKLLGIARATLYEKLGPGDGNPG